MSNLKDYGTSTVLTAPTTPTAGTSLVVQSGHGARFPVAPFYITAHPTSEFPTLDNAEKLLVTVKSTDTFTITRAQGDTTAKSIEAGWRVSNSLFSADIPTLPVKASGAELDALTDDAKFLTAKAVQDGKNVPHVVPGTSGNIIQSDGTDWLSVADPHAANTVLAPTGGIQMYSTKIAPTGWLLADGSAVSRSTYAALYAVLCPSGTFTITIGANAIITKNGHGLVTGDSFFMTTSGALPTGITANTLYYVIYIDANTFYLATTFALSNASTKGITSGSQSGTHTLTFCPYGLGDASTTFNVPNFKGKVPVGINSTDAEFDTLGVSAAVGEKAHVITIAELAAHTHTLPGAVNVPSGSAYTVPSVNITSPYGTSSRGSDAAHNNIQPYLVVTYIIKT